ncbi:transcriptional repressor [Bradyrhizobium sp. CIAT3101]|uniref:iron response transcriptional regulator IrrA n=1 Tax=Bradyrhizobium sp. CIAT3101 TaxID=439387 RepID=UPI0024B04174|nr:transcriptional repressor [Bradyrhizobium sp. CIAT3101]WFU80397.1 transcriptional repressor [Bradyrhizobium sp. CIAT3101]
MDGRSANKVAGARETAQPELAPLHWTGYSAKSCIRRLREAGMRPTRRRVLLAQLLFARGPRHVTAEMLFNEAIEAHIEVALATVYNTLSQFTQAGLLRRIMPNRSRSFFDTDARIHPHFYLVGEDTLIDIPEKRLFEQMPEALPGYEISRLDIIVHIRRTRPDNLTVGLPTL